MPHRQIITIAAACATTIALLATHPLPAAPIRDIILDTNNIHKWDNSNGDTWDPFWAEDGNLYAFNCDGRGFGTAGRNLSFNKLVGPDAHHLVGSMVNPMDAFGGGSQKEADGATCSPAAVV